MSENLPSVPDARPLAEVGGSPPGFPMQQPAQQWMDGQDESTFSLGRYLAAVRRYWWVVLLSVGIGLAGASWAYQNVAPTYTARGSLWISADSRPDDRTGPIQQAELLRAGQWLDLLRSFAVLDPVVSSERLYLNFLPADSAVFEEFALAEQFRPGEYRLQVSRDGSSYRLFAGEEVLAEEGEAGSPIGAGLGFSWVPPAGSLKPGSEIAFSVVTPRDAALGLAQRLQAEMDRAGTFIVLELSGRNRDKIARTLDAIMNQHVEVAAALKRVQLDELTSILQQQLVRVEGDLQAASNALERFRVATILLPSEESGPIAPGLAQTSDPVISEYFQLRLNLEQLQSDREKLASALAEMQTEDGVRVETLEIIPAVRNSSQLMDAIGQLTSAKAELGLLRETYTDEYQPVRELIDRISSLERVTIPSLTRNLMAELGAQATNATTTVETRGQELTQIPPRAMEEARLVRNYDIQDALYRELRQRYETANLAAASSIPDVRILEPVAVPFLPANDQRIQMAALALLAALGLGLAVVFLLDRLDPKLRDPDDIGADIGLEMLSTIPRLQPGGLRGGNQEQVREAFRELRMKLDFSYGATKPLVVAITSPQAAEGKTFISANLASSFADLGRRTILIDGDTRRGKLHEVLDRSRKPGLVDFLSGNASQRIIQDTDNAKLHFIGFGSRSQSSPELLNSSHMQGLLAGLKRRYEVVIFDCPPLGAGSDAFILGAHAGSVLVVLRSGTTVKDMAIAKLESFLRMPVRILGAVLNDFRPRTGQGYYKYYSHYLPGYETGVEEEVPEGAGANRE